MNFEVSLLDLLTLLVNTILPLLVGLVTTRVTPGKVQAILLAVLTAITWLTGLVAAIAVHYGIWRPTGATDAALSTGRHAA
jgi:archaellum biogenesis protein FlaJ (TadC family)